MALFQEASREDVRLRIALGGMSGSGKTFSMLRIGTGIISRLGGKMGVIDTEHGSSQLYADRFKFAVVKLKNFAPEHYIKAIQAAEAEGITVLGIDGLSPAWTGKGGVLQRVQQIAEAKTGGNTYAAWNDGSKIHDALVDAILTSNCHIIATMRQKDAYVIEKNAKGRDAPRRVGTKVIQRDTFRFEFDIVGIFDQKQNMLIDKTRFSAINGERIHHPDEAFGVKLIDWAYGLLKEELEKVDEIEVMEKRPELKPIMGGATPEQIAEIVACFDKLKLSEANRLTFLEKRQVSRLESLTEEEARDALAKLRKHVDALPPSESAPAPEPPARKVQQAEIDAILSRFDHLSMTPQARTDILSSLGFSTLESLTEEAASELLETLDLKIERMEEAKPPAPVAQAAPPQAPGPDLNFKGKGFVPHEPEPAQNPPAKSEPAPAPVELCTSDQHSRIVDDFLILEAKTDDVNKILAKRGVKKIDDLTRVQADELLAALRPKVEIRMQKRREEQSALESATAVDQLVGRVQGKPAEVAAVDAGARPGAPPTQYGIGRRDDSGRWSMSHGPDPDFLSLTEYMPDHPDDCILILSDSGDHAIFREWNAESSEWITSEPDIVMSNAARPEKPEPKKSRKSS